MSSKTTLTPAKVVDMACKWGEADSPRSRNTFWEREVDDDGGEEEDALGRGKL